MSNFNVNLSGPQGQGAGVREAVRTPVEAPKDLSMFESLADNISKIVTNGNKQAAEARKNAVIKEYVSNEGVYTDALTSGQWNSSQVGMASRANYMKMIASYPEYMTELQEAKKSVFDGTEVGEAQKQIDRENSLREHDKQNASDRGYSFYPGMGADAENKTIEAYKATRRLEQEVEARHKANEEDRAARSDERAGQTHEQALKDIINRDETVKGLLTVADKNFDSLTSSISDLQKNTTLSYEEKQFSLSNNINRIKVGLAAVSATNPSLAGPWVKLVDDMDALGQKMIDPKAKAAGEAEVLKNQFDSIMFKAKIAVVSDPQLRKYVVASQLFNDPTQILLSGSPAIHAWLAGAGSGDPSNKPAPMVGTDNEKMTIKTLKSAINKAQSTPGNDKALEEAVNVSKVLINQTKALNNNQGAINPSSLKELSSFYSSPEFGKLAAAGRIDKETLQGVKEVFQVSYEPAVTSAIMRRLDETIETAPQRNPGAGGMKIKSGKMSDMVDIQFSGSGVVFKDKAGSFQTIGSSFTRKGLDDAAAGLNALIHMGAHMEGTTDYGKYWEDNKHLLMPGYYMKGVKEGTIKGDYKFLGGDARIQKNWELIKKDGQ